jgi:hypothetical protein
MKDNMAKNLPVSIAKKVADDNNLKQVIILGWDGETTHVITYGQTINDCDQAAQGGNKLKRVLGWPESLNANPPRVESLLKKIAALEVQLKELNG